jgi:(p)ppGpp synthase/HD superfamily hydrolase
MASMVARSMFVHAVSIAAGAFQSGRRPDTHELYLTHALDVAQALGPEATEPELSTAVLHDVLEDTDWTKDDLASSGCDGVVLEAVDTLTRRQEEDHDEFVARICATPGTVGATAQRVKLADIEVNLANAESPEEIARLERTLPIVRAAMERSG